MPDETKPQDIHSLDREPSTGSLSQPDTTEHADLNHRIESDTHEEARDETTVSTQPTAFAHSGDPVAPPAEVPAVPPQAVTPVSATDKLPHAGPGLMVLQWLVYALWGWTVLALSGLIILVVSQLLDKKDSGYEFGMGQGISYLLAAVIVLFVISLVCDIFYAKAERKHSRSTGSNVIMIIHAVLFSLFGIGALISSVFGAVQLMIGDTTDSTSAVSTIISGGIVFFLYGITLLRTLRPSWLKGVVKLYWLLMAITIGISVILGVMGPAAEAKLRAQDEVIENELPALANAINEYTQTNGSLPKDLSALGASSSSSRGEYETITTKNLVKYKPLEKLSSGVSAKQQELQNMNVDQLGGTVKPIYHYQLCVTYQTSNGGDSYDYNRNSAGDMRYDTTVYTYGHKAGDTCYDVQTDYQY